MTVAPDYDRLYLAAAKIAKTKTGSDLVAMIGVGLTVKEKRLFDISQPAVDAMTDELMLRHQRGELSPA